MELSRVLHPMPSQLCLRLIWAFWSGESGPVFAPKVDGCVSRTRKLGWQCSSIEAATNVNHHLARKAPKDVNIRTKNVNIPVHLQAAHG